MKFKKRSLSKLILALLLFFLRQNVVCAMYTVQPGIDQINGIKEIMQESKQIIEQLQGNASGKKNNLLDKFFLTMDKAIDLSTKTLELMEADRQAIESNNAIAPDKKSKLAQKRIDIEADLRELNMELSMLKQGINKTKSAENLDELQKQLKKTTRNYTDIDNLLKEIENQIINLSSTN